ncbi:MAG TPA: hypothetical protein VNO30_06585 [Kofleriaceae bacterium]|nr:hypothetical protein [Kofleriaceae bacterium]
MRQAISTGGRGLIEQIFEERDAEILLVEIHSDPAGGGGAGDVFAERKPVRPPRGEIGAKGPRGETVQHGGELIVGTLRRFGAVSSINLRSSVSPRPDPS